MATGSEYGTANGQGVRTATGWAWSCDHCSTTTQLGVLEDADLDVQRWLASVDATHYCWHKNERTA